MPRAIFQLRHFVEHDLLEKPPSIPRIRPEGWLFPDHAVTVKYFVFAEI
jgi:hypothetical protein